jgi:DNA processing protein
MDQHLLTFGGDSAALAPVSPMLEMGAYEALWCRSGITFPRLAALFRANPSSLPSDLVERHEALESAEQAMGLLRARGIKRFGVRVHRSGEYPAKLRDARHPVELLYFQGWWDLVETRCVAVVGTRHPTPEGIRRAQAIAKLLVQDNYTVVSGLAAGIDTAAHSAALDAGGRTIAIIGTPLGTTYPPQNAALQARISRELLVISQVPIVRYSRQSPLQNRLFFPERNVTMSALTEATVIIEAGNTSGTLIQARAALQQKRKLFILDSCFQDTNLTWPKRLQDQGAIRVSEYDELRAALAS